MENKTYKIEELFLSPYATFSKDTKGRERSEEPCVLRTDFQRDRDRIIHSKAFRRLKNKTQVFLRPEGDHFRTRITHTLDVAQISRSIARILNLNEDLTEAIALSHDLGHTPFGHAGERALMHLSNGEFSHEKQGVRVVDVLENDGAGLNLTFEVRNGIINHCGGGNPATLEGKIVFFADRIAYLNHDLDDAIRAKVITLDNLPKSVLETLGDTHGKRINTLIMGVCNESLNKPYVEMDKEIFKAMDEFRNFMFEKVYFSNIKRKEEGKVELMIDLLYKYYYDEPNNLPEFYINMIDSYGLNTVVCDYISTMTDSFLLSVFNDVFIPVMNV